MGLWTVALAWVDGVGRIRIVWFSGPIVGDGIEQAGLAHALAFVINDHRGLWVGSVGSGCGWCGRAGGAGLRSGAI